MPYHSIMFHHIPPLGAFGNDWTQRVLQQVMFPTLPGTPQATSMDTPHTGAREGQEEGGGVERSSSVSAAANVPSVITFVTGNAKKRKEVEEILLTYQTSFQLVAEKVRRGKGGKGCTLGAAVSACSEHDYAHLSSTLLPVLFSLPPLLSLSLFHCDNVLSCPVIITAPVTVTTTRCPCPCTVIPSSLPQYTIPRHAVSLIVMLSSALLNSPHLSFALLFSPLLSSPLFCSAHLCSLLLCQVDLPELQGEPVDIAIEKCRLAADTLSE